VYVKIYFVERIPKNLLKYEVDLLRYLTTLNLEHIGLLIEWR